MHELEADDAGDEARDEQHLRHRDRLGSREHAVSDGERGADAHPDGVRGAGRQRLDRLGQANHAQHQRD